MQMPMFCNTYTTPYYVQKYTQGLKGSPLSTHFLGSVSIENELLNQQLLIKDGRPVSLLSVLKDLDAAIKANPGPKKNKVGIAFRNVSMLTLRFITKSLGAACLLIGDPIGLLEVLATTRKAKYHENPPEFWAKTYEVQYLPYLHKDKERELFSQYSSVDGASQSNSDGLFPIEKIFAGPLKNYVTKSPGSGGWRLTQAGSLLLNQESHA